MHSTVCLGLVGLFAAAGCSGPRQETSSANSAAKRRLTWAGIATSGATAIPLQFEFSEDILSGPMSDGAIAGAIAFPDPITGQLVSMGTIHGKRSGATATWATGTGLTVSGTISGNTFSGSALFPGALGYPDLSTTLNLTRQAP